MLQALTQTGSTLLTVKLAKQATSAQEEQFVKTPETSTATEVTLVLQATTAQQVQLQPLLAQQLLTTPKKQELTSLFACFVQKTLMGTLKGLLSAVHVGRMLLQQQAAVLVSV